MNPTAERLYAAAPVWMQHVLVSAYGATLRRRRFGPAHARQLAALREAQWLPPGVVARAQLERLNRLLQRARASVPFYAHRIPTRPLRTLVELTQLPQLTKGEVIAVGDAMLEREARRESLLSIDTGGTTGTPMRIACTRNALRRNYAFFARFRESAGVPADARVATFAGRVLLPPGTDGPPFWRYNHPGRAMLYSSYHIGPATLAAYADGLAAFAPHWIDAYPSSIAPIARHLLQARDTRVRPRAVITSSETLSPEDAQAIAEAFACTVFDHYGSAEMVALITQCRDGSYHVNSDYGVVELLDGTRPVSVGEEGDLVATGFVNPVMPFIRYRTGDRAVRGPDTRCACGSPFPRVERIVGRSDDLLVTPEGHQVGRLDPIFKGVAALTETRIVQDARDHVRVEMVSPEPLGAETIASLRDGLRNRLGPTMRIDFVRLPALERTGAGKLRAVVNLTGARSGSHPATPPAIPVSPD